MVPRPQIDNNSSVPLYRQLYEQLRDQIRSGVIADGDRLPATRELAGLLNLNRTTVAAAYELLETEGLIKGHVGRGSFVNLRNEPDRSWRHLLPPTLSDTPPDTSAARISFATSRPSSDLFPLDTFRQCAQTVLSGDSLARILQLGSPLGYEPLRRWLFNTLRNELVAADTDDVLITNGCQQALDLLERTFVEPGDLVFVEDPVYPGLKAVFQQAGARLHGIPISDYGLDIDELARQLRRERPKLLIVTPNFQNPTGATLPADARQEVVRLAREHGVVLVENDIYSPLRYEGEPLPVLKSLDPDVIQLGSFSKVAFPGLRVGWMLAPQPVTAHCAQAKQSSDLHSDQLSQAILYNFAAQGHLEAHRHNVIRAGAERLATTLDALARHFPALSHFTRPLGGMNLWVRLPASLDTADLLPKAVAAGVSYLPGRFFNVLRNEPNCLRLSFAGVPPHQIGEGIQILGQLFTAELGRERQTFRAPATAMV
ncbi:MAG: PLP-dependent aminotransferase family protein [Bryobacterales bacterium]|nr:PLP-dependent aminotransferase family protein [Bryobacterales bacterium]